MKTGKVESILRESGIKVSRPTLLKDIENLNLEIRKTATGENIFMWKDIFQFYYYYKYNNQKLRNHIITICQNKGGVGKTTSVINLAVALSYLGKTLIIDYDAQANLSQAFDYYPNESESLQNALSNNQDYKESIFNISNTLDIIPNNFFFDEWLEENKDHTLLNKLIRKFKNQYQFILIDTPPTLQTAFKSAVYASDYCLIPFETQRFALEGLLNILDKIKSLSEVYDRDIKNLGIFINKFEKTSSLSTQILEIMKDDNNNLLFNTIIQKSQSLANSQADKKNIFEYEEGSVVSYSFYKLVLEILERVV